jgi:PAS domain S-box-containing protein
MLIQRDQQGAITYVNTAALQLTGHAAEELLRPGFFETLVHADDVPLYQAARRKVSNGDSTRVEMRLRAKDQTVKTVLAFLHPTIDNGEFVGSTSLVVDLSAQRRLEQELEQAKHLEFVGRLASGVVHDFNNLLQVLMGTAALARLDVSPEHPVWQQLDKIEEIGAQASHLAGQILTFSKHRPKLIRPVDVNALVEQTLKLARNVMPPRIDVIADLTKALPRAQGDDIPLKQVLMNLCLNARDAMPGGGKLTIRTDTTPPPERIAPDGKTWVHIAIQDTGVGMDEHVRSRVFEAFFTTKESGTGLGLAVVHRLIEELGGVIDVWSEPGVGTRFDVWLVQAPPLAA